MLLRRFDAVPQLLGDSDEERDRLELAAAHIMSRDGDIDGVIVDELRAIMQAGQEEALRAAYILLCGPPTM